jgi:hypothetical protein
MMWRVGRAGIFLSILVLVAFGNVQRADAEAIVKVTSDLKNGPTENVPLNTEVSWEYQGRVSTHATSEPITKVLYQDTFSDEIDVDGIISIDCGTVTFSPGKQPGTTDVRWVIGDMLPGQTCTLRLQISTDNGPPQEFDESGEHCVNSGARVRFQNALGEQEARHGPPLCVTTI